ncbi:M14 family zinc carboxypeptidase [Lutibacter sp.]|uniref:M14 family zinc carboxypeptidase n=1 Tax=Lutibacter sp. TaxID=1925666 RepID=UPI003569ED9A
MSAFKPQFKQLLVSTCLLVSLFAFSQKSQQSQIISKRIKINNPSYSDLLQIKEVGIDLACGAARDANNNLVLELGESELNGLDSKSINYTVLVDDLIAYYKEKSKTELPLAKKQLEQKKAAYALSSKSISTKSETIDNYVQYEGESEVDWAIPQNFSLGSMNGCLTYSEMLTELAKMKAYSDAKGLNIISAITDASPSNQKTHGNSYTKSGTYDEWSGQPIYYVRISDNASTDEANEPESLYTGMTHSREVSSMMNLIYYMWYLLENYETDPGIKNLVDNHEMYFIPVANPDGLRWNEEISPSGGGLQRKNLGPYNTGENTLRGVDLNRNYNYFWGSNSIYGGSSGTVTDDTYRGPTAFSEPETQIVRDFSATRNFKTAMNHHAYSNLIPHAYNGYPAAPASGRESEYAKFCHEMTRYNRYIYGEAPDVLTIANGDMSDWMLGGVADVNGSTGSGKAILALAPENGSWNSSEEGGFWPDSDKIYEIAQRAMRMNFMNAYFSGKFVQFHDLNPSSITATAGNLKFGLEYLGQTLGNITLTVTPISSNITSITSPAIQTSWSKLEQRNLDVPYVLNASIQANDLIEFQVTVSNDDGYVMYKANIIKYYSPSILFSDVSDPTSLTNWTSTGSWGVTSDAYSGTSAITDSPSGAYSHSRTSTNNNLVLKNSVNLSSSQSVIVQFYAKWDLERNFDYVQLQGSTNGSTWTTLTGKYTKPGSSYSTNRYSSSNSTNTSTGKSTTDQNNQPTGEALYDGNTLNKWVMEEIFIDETNNSFLHQSSTARFRFILDSDSTNRADGYPTTFNGFIFDDFKIISVPCTIGVPTGLTATSITDSGATLNWVDYPAPLYDVRYKLLSSSTWTSVSDISGTTYNLTGLTSNSDYEVQIRSKCDGTTSEYSSSISFTTLVTPPCTGSEVISYPYSESFENTLGLWSQGTSDDIDWSLNSGSTSSNSTGPSSAVNGSYYLYTEATNNSYKEAELISPCFNLTGYKNAKISFYYHWYGSNITTASLILEVSTDNGITYTSIFTKPTGSASVNSWESVVDIDLSAYSGQTIKLKFTGITGSGFRSDMAIDNFSLTAEVDSSLGVEDEILSEFQVYPNPSSTGEINIKMPSEINEFSLTITNILGQKLITQQINKVYNNIHTISTALFKEGVYYISVETDLGKATKKIVLIK